MVGILDEEGRFRAVYGAEGEHWLFSTEWYQGMYSESDMGDGYKYCTLHFAKPGVDVAREEWPIQNIRAHINANGIIESINYVGWPITE